MKRFQLKNALLGLIFLCASAAVSAAPDGKPFWHFDSGQVRPLALSPDGSRLFVVNTPDNHLEIFDITTGGLAFVASVPVGLEPVAVSARSNTEVWVVNHLSDSISIVDAGALIPKVTRTLHVGDEPRDIVFAGTAVGGVFPRAFITTAHRGQAYPDDMSGDKYGDFFTPSTGRADIWVFDANNLGTAIGGTAETVITLFGDTPRALAVTPDGSTVYAAVFHSGNKTTILPDTGYSYIPNFSIAPPTATILQDNGTNWVDSSGTAHSGILLQLPDTDVFQIDADAGVPAEIDSFAGVGTILFNMAVDPSTGKLYVTNTEANNLVPHESAITGNLHRSRITIIDGLGTVVPRHLNKHITYGVNPSPAGVKEASLATPMEMVIASDGTLYVAAFGSSSVGVFDTAELDADSFTPSAAAQIAVSGGGPSGIVLDDANNRLYVLTRFDNSISIIDRTAELEVDHIALHNPEPASVIAGKPFLYDARVSSSNGEASCSSCHIFGRMDDLAWDLGDTVGSVFTNPNPFRFSVTSTPIHPLKGPMTTQSLRGMANQGPMHWRGDRSGAIATSGGDALDEDAGFKEFNPAFVGLMGRDAELNAGQMQAFSDMILQLAYPPNPVRNIDNSMTAAEAEGENIYNVTGTDGAGDGAEACNFCHVLNAPAGFFGTDGLSSFENFPQDMKIPHMRNLYQKVGMFGAPVQNFSVVVTINIDSAGPPDLPQVRGFGYTHSGTVDTLESFVDINLFSYPGIRATAVRQLSEFLIAFPSDLAPVVGQQVTLAASSSTEVDDRIDVFIQRAQAAYPSPDSPNQMECDLIVQGQIAGVPMGAIFNTATSLFDTDNPAQLGLTDAALRDMARANGGFTYTCAPPGSGHRMAIDRDLDGLANYLESVDLGSDPANADSDADGVDDGADNCILVANPTQCDGDGDNYGNHCDADFNNDLIVNGLDIGPMKASFGGTDAETDLNCDGIVNGLDIGPLKAMFGSSPGPSGLMP